MEQVREVLREGGVEEFRRTAAELRRRARTDRSFLQRLALLLRDPSEPLRLRELAALVLGSLPDPEALQLLAGALAESRDPSFTKLLILALGSAKDAGEEDDFLEEPGGPWVVESSTGLAFRVRSGIDDEAVRAEILRHIRDDADIRWAIAASLGPSLAHADVRGAFLEALPGEVDPAAQGELAKALAEWAASEPAASAERGRVLGAILDQGAREGAEALRFRSEQGLVRAAMSEPEIRRLTPFLEGGSFDQRRWAMAVLGAKAADAALPARTEILGSLGRVVTQDADPKMRGYAAAALASFGDQRGASDLLVLTLRDPEWEVRVAAARSLGRLGRRSDDVLEALRWIAEKDPDGQVRAAALQSTRLLASPR